MDTHATAQTITYDGAPLLMVPTRVTAGITNQAVPLDCGHRHVTGDTIWAADTGPRLVWCERCVGQAS